MTHRVTELHGYKTKTNLSSSTTAYTLPRHEQKWLLKPVRPRPYGSSHRFYCYMLIMSFVIPAHNLSILSLFCQPLAFLKTSTKNKLFLEHVPWATWGWGQPKIVNLKYVSLVCNLVVYTDSIKRGWKDEMKTERKTHRRRHGEYGGEKNKNGVQI